VLYSLPMKFRAIRFPSVVFSAATLLAACGGMTGTGADTGASSDGSGQDASTMDMGTAADASPSDSCGDSPVVTPNPMVGHSNYVPTNFPAATPVRLIVLGDSISDGTGASAASLQYANLLANNNDTQYPTEATTDLQSRYGGADAGAFPVLHIAVGGATTYSMWRDQLPALRNMFPIRGHSLAVITIGGNDLVAALASGGAPDGQVLTDAINYLTQTATFLHDPANFPDGVSLVLATVYDPTDGEGFARNCFLNLRVPQFIPGLDVWRERYRMLGMSMNFAVVDALGHFHGHAKNYMHVCNPYYDTANPVQWFSTADCIHPGDLGHNEFRRLFFQAVDPTYVVER